MWGLALTAYLLWGSVHTVHSAGLEKSGIEGNNTFFFCQNDGKVIWSKGVDGGRAPILTAKHGEAVIHHKPDHRYSVLSDLSLLIKNLSLADSGIYYCNSTPVVYLTVTPLQRSTAETEKVSAGKGSVAETDVDSTEKGMKSRPVMEIISEGKVSGATKEKDDDEHDDDDEDLDTWTAAAAAAVVGMGCVLVLLVALLVWRVFTRKKAAPQPAEFSFSQNQTHVYASISELPEASQCDDEQRESEAVYFLAQNPTPNTTGVQERGENEAVYSLATAPVFIDTDQKRAEQLYAMIQKRSSNTGRLSLQHD